MSKPESCANQIAIASARVTTTPAPFSPGWGARWSLPAEVVLTPTPDPIDPDAITAIRLYYRLAKSAERSRIQIDQQLMAFARVYLTDWAPDAAPLDRTKANTRVARVLKAVRSGADPEDGDVKLYTNIEPMVLAAEPTRRAFEAERKQRRRMAEKLVVASLPAWKRLEHIRGLSAWGLAVIVGEAGDIGRYPGCRHLYKRLGLAPDACYPVGEKKTGRKIPRNTRGRVMGVIADPLMRAQWRGAKDEAPAHAIGPYGAVYGRAKRAAIAREFIPVHAEKLARRVMTKALLHDVHRAWHGKPLTYRFLFPEEA